MKGQTFTKKAPKHMFNITNFIENNTTTIHPQHVENTISKKSLTSYKILTKSANTELIKGKFVLMCKME